MVADCEFFELVDDEDDVFIDCEFSHDAFVPVPSTQDIQSMQESAPVMSDSAAQTLQDLIDMESMGEPVIWPNDFDKNSAFIVIELWKRNSAVQTCTTMKGGLTGKRPSDAIEPPNLEKKRRLAS